MRLKEHAQIMKQNMKNLLHLRIHLRTLQYNMVHNDTSSLDVLDTGVSSCLSCLVLRCYYYRTPCSPITHLECLDHSPEVPVGLLGVLVTLKGDVPRGVVDKLTRHNLGTLLALEHRLSWEREGLD